MMDKNNTQNNLKLQQTIRFFETLLRASADGIVITDPACNIIFVNEKFCEFFSRKRQDLLETNLFIWLEKLDHNARDIWKGLESQINEHGIAKDVEFAMKAGKEKMYYSVNSSLLEKIDIEYRGLIINIWRDDTERKIAKDALVQAHDGLEMIVKERTVQLTDINIALSESKQFIETIVNLSPDSLYIYDLTERKNVYSNDGIERILSYSVKEVQEMGNKLLPILMHPDDFKIYLEQIYPQYSKLKDKQPITHEYRMKHKNGQWTWLDCNEIIYKRLQDGSPKQILGVVHDITQRKHEEEKLRKSEERFRKLVETEPECVKLLTEDNILIDMNPAGLGMIEADSLEQVSSKSILEVIDPEYQEAFVDVGRRVFKGESASLEFSITGLKGTKRWLETHAVPLRDDFGKINFLLAVTRDVTERKRAQEERIQLIEREHEARAEADAARKLDRMKSMFIAATSHELRTPLNSIIGFTSLAIDGTFGELNPDQKKHLMLVHSSGKHLLSLINDILDLSMIESGNIVALVCEFNLRQIVDEAATNLNVILNEKNLRLKVDVGNIIMKSDRMRMLQCLINLISNAVKYTEKGSIGITAKVIGKNVEISITDTGIGIQEEDIPKLFGPFVRLQSPLTFKTSGTGLGLYLVKKIAEDVLGGDIEVESEYGKGSKFTLRVPVEREVKS